MRLKIRKNLGRANLNPNCTVLIKKVYSEQSCESGRAFRIGFGPKVDKNFGLNSGLSRSFCRRCTKI